MIQILEEEEEEGQGHVQTLEKTANFAEYTIVQFNDKQFKQHFRLNRETFEILLRELNNDNMLVVQAGQPEILLEKQLLITLWCLANIECFRSVADRFGVGKASCWRIIGAIDGCHIRILKPMEYPNPYINRKGYPSILLQGICDNKKLFLDVYAGELGSLHDARLFTKSDIFGKISNGEIDFPNNTHLIGDLAYPLSTYLLVGFKDNGNLSEPPKLFNRKLPQSRIVIENAFGILKGRFRRLKFLETKRLDLIALLIVSSCILHNLCILNNDLYEGPIEENEQNDQSLPHITNPGAAAVTKRMNLVNYLYNRFHI
ncbi:unnamed protein product [Callosobruchus maculatus]|uniref:DDE Tnp4 domain-containing protein n=1 Tax=Callosobruchus maculatus TaxID=64391 RepID=A0A653CEW2_CALMS|nr:unnamed protein product [Callosobruchus maculatus]